MAKSGFAAAAQAVEQQQKALEASKAPEYNRLSIKLDEPAKQVRFVVQSEDDVITFTEHWTEMNNGWKRNTSCPNEEIGDDNCIVCRSKKGKDYVSDQRKAAHMINVIDRAEGTVKVLRFAPMLMSALFQAMKDNGGNITDRDFTVQFATNTDENIKSKWIYNVTPATPKAVALTKKDLELIESRYDLNSLIPVYNEESLERVMKMAPGEGNKSNAKAATTAEDLIGMLASGGNLTDEFSGLTNGASAPTATATATATSAPAAENLDFDKLLEDIEG